MKSHEDYLETILYVTQKKGRCRAMDISQTLGVTRASTSVAIHKMEEEGFVRISDDNLITLTEKGREIAENVMEKHQFLLDLFTTLGVPEDVAEKDAHLVEHNLHEETFDALKQLKDYVPPRGKKESED